MRPFAAGSAPSGNALRLLDIGCACAIALRGAYPDVTVCSISRFAAAAATTTGSERSASTSSMYRRTRSGKLPLDRAIEGVSSSTPMPWSTSWSSSSSSSRRLLLLNFDSVDELGGRGLVASNLDSPALPPNLPSVCRSPTIEAKSEVDASGTFARRRALPTWLRGGKTVCNVSAVFTCWSAVASQALTDLSDLVDASIDVWCCNTQLHVSETKRSTFVNRKLPRLRLEGVVVN
jgi:hypothetical protein